MISLVHDMLLRAAERSPGKPALVHGRRSLTFSELLKEVARLARVLARANVRPGDRVAIHFEKSIEEAVAILAVSMAGAVSVNINALLRARQVRHILGDSGACALITSYGRLRSLGGGLRDCPRLSTLVAVGKPKPLDDSLRAFSLVDADTAVAEASSDPLPSTRIDRDIAAIIYTSGSTGLPKGVVLSHRNIVAGAESVSAYLRNTSDDRILSVLPFSFDYGLNQFTTALLVGATLILKNYLNHTEVLRAIEKERITGLAGVPTLWSQLLQSEWDDVDLGSLRYITNSGGRFAEEQVREYRKRIPHTDIYLMYGLTEAFRSTYLEPQQVDTRPTSIGKAIPNAEILVVNEEGGLCRPGEIGELVHRGAHVALGYWNDPELTARRFRPSPVQNGEIPSDERVVYSGDLVQVDDDGYLYFVGRADQMIKTSGFRVSPTEVEEYFYNTGLVQDVVAFEVPDPVLGGAIAVTLSLRPGVRVDTQELLSLAAREMPRFMVPRKVRIMERLPTGPTGKLDRTLLSTLPA